jgi:lysozyme family protein
VDAAGELDLVHSSPTVLSSLIENADACAGAFNLGLSTIGQLVAHAAVEVEDGTIGAESIEALGWMLAELGNVAAFCVELAACCRQANVRREA